MELTLDVAEGQSLVEEPEREQPEKESQGRTVSRTKNWSDTSNVEMKMGQDLDIAGKWWQQELCF